MNADGEEHPVWIDWSAKKAKYWLVSPGLSRIKTKDNPKISLTRRLNQMQPFRIITRDLAHTYVGGDHVIFVGEVISAEHDPAGRPLLFYRGSYTSILEGRDR